MDELRLYVLMNGSSVISGRLGVGDDKVSLCVFVCCCLTSTVNSYGHAGTVSQPNHTVPGQARPPKRLSSTKCQYFRL